MSETISMAEADAQALLPHMLYKIRKNIRKPCPTMNPGGEERRHDHASVEWLISRIKDELTELEEALEAHDLEGGILECADIANFAAFCAGNLRRELERRADPDARECQTCFEAEQGAECQCHQDSGSEPAGTTSVLPVANEEAAASAAPPPASSLVPGAEIWLADIVMTVLTTEFERAGTFPDASALVFCEKLPDGTHVNTPWGYVCTTRHDGSQSIAGSKPRKGAPRK